MEAWQTMWRKVNTLWWSWCAEGQGQYDKRFNLLRLPDQSKNLPTFHNFVKKSRNPWSWTQKVIWFLKEPWGQMWHYFPNSYHNLFNVDCSIVQLNIRLGNQIPISVISVEIETSSILEIWPYYIILCNVFV